MTFPEGPLQRGWRPAIGWGGVALVIICLLFIFVVAMIALYALWRWANGQQVDMQGFAAVLTAATAAGAAVWSLVKQYIIGRTTQHVEAIRSGQGAPPFPYSTPEGPRPGDSP